MIMKFNQSAALGESLITVICLNCHFVAMLSNSASNSARFIWAMSFSFLSHEQSLTVFPYNSVAMPTASLLALNHTIFIIKHNSVINKWDLHSMKNVFSRTSLLFWVPHSTQNPIVPDSTAFPHVQRQYFYNASSIRVFKLFLDNLQIFFHFSPAAKLVVTYITILKQTEQRCVQWFVPFNYSH